MKRKQLKVKKGTSKPDSDIGGGSKEEPSRTRMINDATDGLNWQA